MNYLGRILKGIDYSSVNYAFHINGKESFRTKFGGLLYFCYSVFFLYFAIKLSLDFLYRINYSIIFIDKILPTPPELPLQQYNLSFAFSINYENNSPLADETLKKYLVEKVYFVTMKNSTSKTKKEIKYKPCEKKDLFTKFNNPDTDYKELSKWRCLEDRNFTLTGGFNDEIFQYIEYAVFLNYTTFLEEKMNFQNNFFGKTLINVVIKYFEMGIDVDDYYQPLRSYDYNIFDYISISKIKKVNLDFSRYEFQNDAQVLFGEAESELFLRLGSEHSYSYDMYDRSQEVNDYNVLFKYFIRSSPNVSIVKRGYQKLWDLLANIGGLVGQILLGIVFINTFYNKFKSKEELVNNLLKFKDNYNVNNNTNDEIKKLQEDYIKIVSKQQNNNYESIVDYDCRKSEVFNKDKPFSHNNKNNINKTNICYSDNNFSNLSNNNNTNINKKREVAYDEDNENKHPYSINDITKSDLIKSRTSIKNCENENDSFFLNRNIYKSNFANDLNSESPYNASGNRLLNSYLSKSPKLERDLNLDPNITNRDYLTNSGSNNKKNKNNFFSNLLNKKKENRNKTNSSDSDNLNIKDQIVQLNNIDLNKKNSENKENQRLNADEIDIQMKESPRNKQPKVIFVNKNLNLLRNSLFTKQTKFFMKKLLSIKDVSSELKNHKASNSNNNSDENINDNNNNVNVSKINNHDNNDESSKDNQILNDNKSYINNKSDYRSNKASIKKDENKLDNEIHNVENKNKNTKLEILNLSSKNFPEEIIENEDEEKENIKQIFSHENLDSFPFNEDECDEKRNGDNLVYSFSKNPNMNVDYFNRAHNHNNIENKADQKILNTNEGNLRNEQILPNEELLVSDFNTKKFSFNGIENFISRDLNELKEKKDIVSDICLTSIDLKNKVDLENKALALHTKQSIQLKNIDNFDTVSYRTFDLMLEQKNYINDDKISYNEKAKEDIKNLNANSIKTNLTNGSNLKTDKIYNKTYNNDNNNFSNNDCLQNSNIIQNKVYNKKEKEDSPPTRYELSSLKSNPSPKKKSEVRAKAAENSSIPNNKENKKEKKIHFDFSWYEIFCKCLCISKSKQIKYNLYKRSYKSISEHLNIYFYLKLIQEIEIVKSLVFSYEQIGLINFVAKPMICNEVNSNLYIDEKQITEIFREESSLENALEFFREIVDQRKFNDIDHKLVKMFLHEFESISDHGKLSTKISK